MCANSWHGTSALAIRASTAAESRMQHRVTAYRNDNLADQAVNEPLPLRCPRKRRHSLQVPRHQLSTSMTTHMSMHKCYMLAATANIVKVRNVETRSQTLLMRALETRTRPWLPISMTARTRTCRVVILERCDMGPVPLASSRNVGTIASDTHASPNLVASVCTCTCQG